MVCAVGPGDPAVVDPSKRKSGDSDSKHDGVENVDLLKKVGDMDSVGEVDLNQLNAPVTTDKSKVGLNGGDLTESEKTSKPVVKKEKELSINPPSMDVSTSDDDS